jgi:hypothetical protein
VDVFRSACGRAEVSSYDSCNGCAQLYIGSALLLEEALTPRPANNDGLDKFQRYRANRRAGGMKLLRVWVPDPSAPGFRQEAERQARLLRNAPEEHGALDFIDPTSNRGDAQL